MHTADNPCLSICIPTYNRSAFLEKTLDCIAAQQIFVETNLVEVVVSDNHSTDDTAAVALDFQARFPQKIRYIRTKEHVHSSINFANALGNAHGKLCKLHNDSFSIDPGFMEATIELVQKYADEHRVLFFLNGNTRCLDVITSCTTMDDFVSHVSFYMTWIGGFSLWDKDIPSYIQYFTEANHHLAQAEILLTLLERGRSILVYNVKFGEGYPGVTKTVNTKFLEDVYIREYVPLLKRHSDSTLLQHEIYAREVKRLVIFYYIPYYYRLKTHFQLSFLKDFAFLKQYVSLFQYYLILFMYPLYACMHARLGNVKQHMPFILLRKILHG